MAATTSDAAVPARTTWSGPETTFRRRFSRNRLSMVGVAIIAGFLVVGVLATWIAPYPYAAFDIAHRLSPPSSIHLMGTDQFGRDTLSRVIYGARISLTVAIAATFIGTLVGIAVGAVAGFVSGWIDEVAMRSMDVILAFPPIVLALAMAALLEPSLQNVILIIGFLIIPQFARVTRGSVLAVMNQEYVTASRVVGQREREILLRHILPNTVGPLVVLASLTIPGAILTEAALSYLGVGVQLPTPSWGNMIADGSSYLLQAPWLTVFPGLVISICVLGFNLVGDGLRDALDTSTPAT
jgi:peptide/nickel transport system permease protein